MSRCVAELKDSSQKYNPAVTKLFQYEDTKTSEFEHFVYSKNIHQESIQWTIALEDPVWISDNIFHKNISPSHKNTNDEDAFKTFKAEYINDPKFRDKFVAFVNGKFQDIGDDELELIEAMNDKFGDVEMFVGMISKHENIERLHTPRFID